MKLGLGTVQLGMPYGVANRTGQPGIAEALEILTTATAGGVDCFDTAGLYGDSESVLGRFIQESGQRPKLCSKFSDCATAGDELLTSLERLRVDKLNYFLLHKPDQIFHADFDRALAALARNPAVGKPGVSVYTPRETEESLRHDIQVLQVPFNIVDTRLLRSGLLEKAKARGIEIHARSVYLQGLLLTDDPRVAGYVKSIDELAAELGLARKELLLAYVRDCVVIDRFFIGCETAEQVRETLALMRTPPLPDWVMDRVVRAFTEVPEEILNPALWRK